MQTAKNLAFLARATFYIIIRSKQSKAIKSKLKNV